MHARFDHNSLLASADDTYNVACSEIRNCCHPQGYDTYILIFYVFVAIIYALIAGVIGLTLAMRKGEKSKWLKRYSSVLQVLTEVVFTVLYMWVFDYMVIVFNCAYGEGLSAANHELFTEDVPSELVKLRSCCVDEC